KTVLGNHDAGDASDPPVRCLDVGRLCLGSLRRQRLAARQTGPGGTAGRLPRPVLAMAAVVRRRPQQAQPFVLPLDQRSPGAVSFRHREASNAYLRLCLPVLQPRFHRDAENQRSLARLSALRFRIGDQEAFSTRRARRIEPFFAAHDRTWLRCGRLRLPALSPSKSVLRPAPNRGGGPRPGGPHGVETTADSRPVGRTRRIRPDPCQ
ncbi:hypothetical protein, partial [Plasmodium yoelii yoelii]